MNQSADVTQLLQEYRAGNRAVLDKLFPLVYGELRRVAAAKLHRERADHTLQATALVHEAYLRLVSQHSVDWQNRAHFFGIAAEMMRRILVNHYEANNADKRGAEAAKIQLDDAVSFVSAREIDLIGLDEALNRLQEFAPRQAKVVEMRFFGGLSIEEVAVALQVDERTVGRDWRAAKAWLHNQLYTAS